MMLFKTVLYWLAISITFLFGFLTCALLTIAKDNDSDEEDKL